MTSDLLAFLLRANLALAAAVMLALVLRKPVRAAFGARAAYGLWLIAPLAVIAMLLPARVISVAAPPPVTIASTPPTSTPERKPTPTPSVEAKTLPPVATRPRVQTHQLRDGLAIAWALIALLAIGVQAERQRRFLRSLGRLRGEADLFHAEHAGVGPAVIGALMPKVVLPADFGLRFTPEEQALILAHERNHLRAGDAQINALTTALQCVFWFNPLVHIGARLMRIDQEIACDAAVLSRLPVARRAYGEAMLKTQLAPHAPPLGCHWPASANKQLKERFVMLKEHRQGRARRLAGGAAVTALALGVGVAAWASQPARVVHRAPAEAARPQTPTLLAAIRQGDAEKVRKALAEVTARNPDDTALLAAVRRGDLATVRVLVGRGADVNEATNDGTPLTLAARTGRADIINLLLGNGADADQATHGDGTPLTNAVLSGDKNIVTELLKNGADANRATNDGTPLILAARTGRSDLVKLLVDNGADTSLRSRGDGDPLINAVSSGDAASVRYLLNNGADINQTTRGDGSPLIAAARSGRADMVKLLLDKGADPAVAVRGDGNPLIAAAHSGNLDVVRMLVERGASVESYVPGDETPLINAAQAGDLASVRYLVEKGANVSRAVPADNGEMRSPLSEAVKHGRADVVDYLKAQGAQR
jgi:beta-lactamase regulating signal transducer with metallopeptidase domain/ankyrin repeat protein